ncbi:MAG: hypothetical protein SFU53_03890 [Terrimicrobiaceae bacterium]|nr:hypothetical protein [Terrimicrobiaceae bacterium]
MRTIALALFLAAPAVFAEESQLTDHPLQDVKAALQIPAGWESTKEAEDGVYVYQFGKGKGPGSTSVTLSVTTGVPDRTGQPPSEYAAALIDMSQDEGSESTVQKGEFQGMKSLRVEYDFDCETGRMHAVNVAIANDKTGTLYFFAWQTPLDESVEMEAIREKILTSARFDPAF